MIFFEERNDFWCQFSPLLIRVKRVWTTKVHSPQQIIQKYTNLFSAERLLPDDADVDKRGAGRHGGAQVPGAQGHAPSHHYLVQERRPRDELSHL